MYRYEICSFDWHRCTSYVCCYFIHLQQSCQVSISTKTSAFHAIGASLSALAARVANTYDLQGPAVTINTACSSALVAVHEAMKDAKTGRIDFAIVGGVNLFGEDLQLFHHLRRAAMLSPSGKCHTFSAEADGYVRAEGGVLFLLAREDLELPSHGCILGSAVTQNSRQGSFLYFLLRMTWQSCRNVPKKPLKTSRLIGSFQIQTHAFQTFKPGVSAAAPGGSLCLRWIQQPRSVPFVSPARTQVSKAQSWQRWSCMALERLWATLWKSRLLQGGKSGLFTSFHSDSFFQDMV